MATAESDKMETVEYENFINGKWVAPVTGKTLENRNLADTRELVGTFQKSDKRDGDKAVATAAKAFKSWLWCRLPNARRSSSATGNGHREAGQAALDVFPEWKPVHVDFSGTLQKAQIDT